MQEKSKFEDKLYIQYYQFVEFINQHKFAEGVALFLIHMANIVVIIDLLSQLSTGDTLIVRLTGIYYSQIILKLLQNNPIFIRIFQSLLIFMLTLPLMILILLLIMGLTMKNLRIQNQKLVRNSYRQFRIFSVYRTYNRSFSEIAFPIIMQLSIKLIIIQNSVSMEVRAVGISIIIMNFLNLFIYIYYDLEIYPEDCNYRRKNYKGVLADSCILGAMILVVNMSSGLAPFIVTCVCFLIRFMLTCIWPIFPFGFQIQRKFSLVACFAISLCFLTSNITGQNGLMFCVAVCLIVLLKVIKNIFILKNANQNSMKIESGSLLEDYSQYQQETNMNNLDTLKRQLWGGQKFVQVFRGLVQLSRQKSTHRQQLMISILKNKCNQQQIMTKGGSKIANPCDMFTYETHITQTVSIITKVAQTAFEIFQLMKSKQHNQELFLERVLRNTHLIEQGKRQLDKALKINNNQFKVVILLNILFKGLQTDKKQLRERLQIFREQILTQDQLKSREKLFSANVALVVINVMEQIGKITRISKNMSQVLGYNSHHLLNLPINGLMPFTIRQIHDQVLQSYINTFEASKMKKKSKIQSYAYNKNFHFQKVSVEYKFLMNNFQTLELSGVLEKIQTQQFLIFTNHQGNLEGWTQQIGQILNLNDVAGSQCQNYNLLPLLPCLIKYKQNQICCRTILFKPSRIKNQKLSITQTMKSWDNLQEKQMASFKNLMQEQQILDAFFVDLEVRKINYLSGKFYNRSYKFNNIKRIENLQKILSFSKRQPKNLKESKLKNNTIFKNSLNSVDQLSEYDFSIIKSDKQIKNLADLNFDLTENGDGKNYITYEDIQFEKDDLNNITFFSSRKLARNQDIPEDAQIQSIDKESNYDFHHMPKIKRKFHTIWFVIVVAIAAIGILIFDQNSLQQAQIQLRSNSQQIKKINRIQMILAKSIYNPNQTYINQFTNGQLMIRKQWFTDYQFSFTISDFQSPISYNYFYILNVQIPSILDGLVSLENNSSTSSRYEYSKKQLSQNYYNFIELFKIIEDKQSEIWKQKINLLKVKTIVIVLAVAVTTIGLSIYLVLMRFSQTDKIKRLEGFFKFQKSDIDDLITQVSHIQKIIKQKTCQWNIDGLVFATTQNDDPVVRRDQRLTTTNSQMINEKPDLSNGFAKILNQKGKNELIKIQLEHGMSIQSKSIDIDSEKYQRISLKGVCGIIVFIGLQIVFLICYGVLNSHKLESYDEIYHKINDAEKLFMLPALEIANLYINTPPQIMKYYRQTLDQVMKKSSPYLIELYNLLEEAPCQNCSYLPQILKTNYHSFYSYFEKEIELRQKNNNIQNISQLVYAVDLVAQKIYPAINFTELPLIALIIILYVVSLILFFVIVCNSLKQQEDQNLKLQSFIKYFDYQTILKNKHLNAIFDKNV